MRVLSILTKSSQYVRQFYGNQHGLTKRPFDDQNEALTADTFGGSEIWSSGLERFGFQSTRIFENVGFIQRQWAAENGLRLDDTSNWREQVLQEQIVRYQPEILFISNHQAISADFLRRIREKVGSIRLIVSWCGSPYQDTSFFQECDFILSNVPELVKDLTAGGLCCYKLNHAFDERVLTKIDQDFQPRIDFSFVGSIVNANGFHTKRLKLLLDLVRTTNLQIWSPLQNPTLVDVLKLRGAQLTYDILSATARNKVVHEKLAQVAWFRRISRYEHRPSFRRYVDKSILKRTHPPVFGSAMFQKLHNSRVTLNTHIDISDNSASNMRLFEATGVGVCLLTDWKPDIRSLFEPEFEVVTYRDSRECLEKVNYLLENDLERRKIARAGQQRAISEHTIHHRAEQLNEIISHFMKARSKRRLISRTS